MELVRYVMENNFSNIFSPFPLPPPSPSLSSETHPCWYSNGGCSHMCVAVDDDGRGLIASCLCPTGYLLQQDKKNCKTS